MFFDLVCINVRYSPQHNSKVGRKSFDNFRSPQADCDKYFLKLHFLNESISAWSNYGPADGICAARGQFCTSLVDYKQRQPFFFEERYDFGTKIETSQIDSN